MLLPVLLPVLLALLLLLVLLLLLLLLLLLRTGRRNPHPGPAPKAERPVTAVAAEALTPAQIQAVSHPGKAGLDVAAPLSLRMCCMVPRPLRKTARGATKEDSSATGHEMPVATVTG